MFSDPKLAINKPLGVSYSVTFPRTNYESKKGLAWDLTDKHHDTSRLFEAICRHPSYKKKKKFSLQISKTRRCKYVTRFGCQNKYLNLVLVMFRVRTRTAGYKKTGKERHMIVNYISKCLEISFKF